MKRWHLFFDARERPFLLNCTMQWEYEVNAFLSDLCSENGHTSSPRTWRSYAYELACFLSFCAQIVVPWRKITHFNLGEYRDFLATEPSDLTKTLRLRTTINHRLTVIFQFYRFAKIRGWIDSLPFEMEEEWGSDNDSSLYGTGPHRRVRYRLKLRVSQEDLLVLPPRSDIRTFVNAFPSWRDSLIAKTMWTVGLRRAELCRLPTNVLPRDPASINRDTIVITVVGKGDKRRCVVFPVSLLRSIDRYMKFDGRGKSDTGEYVFMGRGGKPLQPAAVNRVFRTNCIRTGMDIWPHLLRHAFAVERYMYFEGIRVSNPLRRLQFELGHAWSKTTERYLHIVEQMRSDVVEENNSFIDRLLGGGSQ